MPLLWRARLKKMIGLPERLGLEGLEQVLRLRYSSHANDNASLTWKNDGAALVYKVGDCRVQRARQRKGMPLHPCKSVGLVEYQGVASAVDDRIVCQCLSRFPDVVDGTCCCAWRFTLG